MYKNIEILDKKKHAKIKFDKIDTLEVAKNIGIVPIGVDEVMDMSTYAPVLISAAEEKEFIACTGISKDVTIYNKTNIYIPRFIQGYPFLSVNVKNEKGENNTIIAIDINKNFVGKNKTHTIFNKNEELEKDTAAKIDIIRKLNSQREISRTIIAALEEKRLLLKRDFKIKTADEEKTILNEFYIVDREKLMKLDDETLALWARKGWIGVIDAHIKSIGNFQRIFS